MLNPAQQEILDSLIANVGTYFKTIMDSPSADMGTKMLYLDRAINESCEEFLHYLDKLYQPELTGAAKEANIDLIRSLKMINDLCFNNPIKNGSHGVEDALDHYFGRLGTINANIVYNTIYKIINGNLATRCEGRNNEIELQIQARETAEHTIIEQTAWRTDLDLPLDQQAAPASSLVSAVGFFSVATTHSPIDSASYRYALTSLITNTHNPIRREDAILEIDGLNQEQLLTVYLIAKRVGALPGLGNALRSWSGEFTDHHQKALVSLLTNNHTRLPLQDAIREINGLTSEQLNIVWLIAERVGALRGLGDALRSWSGEFTDHHQKALVNLLTNTDTRLPLLDTIQAIKELNPNQLYAVSKIADRFGASHGLVDELRKWRGEFNYEHLITLNILHTHNKLPLLEAIREIKGLTPEKLATIREVADKIGALPGLGNALRIWRGEFNFSHRSALVDLLTRPNNRLSPAEALQQIADHRYTGPGIARLEVSRCLGTCSLAPVVKIG